MQCVQDETEVLTKRFKVDKDTTIYKKGGVIGIENYELFDNVKVNFEQDFSKIFFILKCFNLLKERGIIKNSEKELATINKIALKKHPHEIIYDQKRMNWYEVDY